jgi:hypothetical protein
MKNLPPVARREAVSMGSDQEPWFVPPPSAVNPVKLSAAPAAIFLTSGRTQVDLLTFTIFMTFLP